VEGTTIGCDLGQGFHYARPIPLDALFEQLGITPPFVATVGSTAADERGEDAPVADAERQPAEVFFDGVWVDDDAGAGPDLVDEPEYVEFPRG